MKKDWKNRPKGCKKTMTGMHIPASYQMTQYEYVEKCKACGIIDDSGERIFTQWLYGKKDEKVNDLEEI